MKRKNYKGLVIRTRRLWQQHQSLHEFVSSWIKEEKNKLFNYKIK